MARLDTFTIRVDEDESRMIADLVDRLQHTQSDAIRLVIRESAKGLGINTERAPYLKAKVVVENGRPV